MDQYVWIEITSKFSDNGAFHKGCLVCVPFKILDIGAL